jgi:hypothetical protein
MKGISPQAIHVVVHNFTLGCSFTKMPAPQRNRGVTSTPRMGTTLIAISNHFRHTTRMVLASVSKQQPLSFKTVCQFTLEERQHGRRSSVWHRFRCHVASLVAHTNENVSCSRKCECQLARFQVNSGQPCCRVAIWKRVGVIT